MKTTSSRKDTLRGVLGYVGRYRGYLVASLALCVITVASTLYVPILTGNAVDLLLGPGAVDFAALWPILAGILALVALTSLAQWFMGLCNNRLTYCTVRDIRHDAFAHIQRLPLSYLDRQPTGDVVSRVIADVDQFADGLLMGFTQLFTGVLTIVGTLFFMFSVNAVIAAAVVVITPLSLLAAAFIARRTFKMVTLQTRTRGEQTALIDEMVTHQKVVRAFSMEDETQRRFDEVNERLEKCSLRAIFYSSLTNPVTRFVNALVYACVGVAGALVAVTTGGITVGQLSAFLSYANQYTKPFNEISGVVTELQGALACAARVLDLIAQPAETPDAPAELSHVDGSVAIRDVSFSYTPDRKLIRHLNLAVSPGQRIAIVGPTGCGKTTLINLLMRDPKEPAQRLRHGLAGYLAQGRHHPRQHQNGPRGRHRRRDDRRRQGHTCSQLHQAPAGGLRHRHHRGRREPQPGAETAPVHHARDAVPASHADFGRGHLLHRHPHRAAHPARV